MRRTRRTRSEDNEDAAPAVPAAPARPRPPPRTTWDRTRFTSRDNARWYEARQNNTIVVEKTVSESLDNLFGITDAFTTLGWESVLTLSGPYYPRLVREFYANIVDKEDQLHLTVTSSVKGCRISLDRDTLAQILGVNNVGPPFVLVKDHVLNDEQFKMVTAMGRLSCGRTWQRHTGTSIIKTSSLTIRQRLLVYLFSANVLPRASSLNEVRISDLYFLDKMLHGLQGVQGVPLSTVILGQMRYTVRSKRGAKSMGYPILLTKIFEFFHVDLADEDFLLSKPTDVLRESSLSNLGYVKVNGVWEKPNRIHEPHDADSGEHSHVPDSHVPSTSAGPSQSSSRGFSTQQALRRIEDLCIGLDARQTVMETRQAAIEAQLQSQNEYLQHIWTALDPSNPHSP